MTGPVLHRRIVRWIEETNKKGRKIYNQTATMRQGFYFNFGEWNLFDGSDVWRESDHGGRRQSGLRSLKTRLSGRLCVPNMIRAIRRL